MNDTVKLNEWHNNDKYAGVSVPGKQLACISNVTVTSAGLTYLAVAAMSLFLSNENHALRRM